MSDFFLVFSIILMIEIAYFLYKDSLIP